MKKLISILLTLVLILGMSTTAFAANAATLSIEGESADREYEGFKLLNLTISLKADDNCTDDNHTDNCYNYAYTVNEKYRSILQQEVFDHLNSRPEKASDVTDAQILDYLAGQEGDNADGYGSLRTVADRIYRAIKDDKLSADKDKMTGTSDVIEQGYWLIADVTDLTDEEAANSLVMLDTKGKTDITVTPKTAIPTVEKKVKDINDSEDATISDNDWQDSADHDMESKDENATIPFKLTATLPSNIANYEEYKIVFHDVMSDGLELTEGTIAVYMYDGKDEADADVSMEKGTVVTDYFTTTTAGLGDGCTFEVGCEDVLEIDGVTKDTVFVVYYEATLIDDAKIGAEGNPNEVYLEFSNNPYDDGTGKTEPDEVIVFTYQVTINKTDAEGNALAGAGFTLYKKDSDGNYNAIDEELGGEGSDVTIFTWKGLDDGDYKLAETTVPDGYNQMADIEFTISAEHDKESENPQLTSLDGGKLASGIVDTGLITKNIENNTGTVLPETGAKGTMMLITCSSMFVVLAAVFMITRKKMSIYED